MSTQILDFKKVELTANTKEEAIEIAEQDYFHVNGDATQAFKNFKEKADGAITEKDIKVWMLDYLAKKGKNCPGAGYIIVLDKAVKDTRQRPYKFTKIKNEGRRKNKKFYVWKDKTTGVEVCSVDTNYTDAEHKMKEMYKEGYRGNVECELLYKITEGNAIVAEASYAPSINTKKGHYIIFGIGA